MATKKEKDFLHSLDKRTAIVEETLIRLETNHLVHLQKQIDKVEARIWALIVGVVLQLVSIVFMFIGVN